MADSTYTDPYSDIPWPTEPPAWLDEATEPARVGHPGDPRGEVVGDLTPASPVEEVTGGQAPARPSVTLLSPALTVEQLRRAGIPAHVTGAASAAVTLGDGLAALRLPAGRPDWRVDAADATGTSPLLNRITWVEQTDEGILLYFRITEPELLAAHATVRGGQRVAELMTEGTVQLGTVARGNRGSLVELSRGEALGVGAFLDWASEISTAPLPQAVDIRSLTSNAARIRDRYNREHPEVEVRNGTVYRAFDLLCGAEKGPEAVADELAEEGTVTVTAEHLRADRIQQVEVNRPVAEVVRDIVKVLSAASQEADATLPLVLAEPGSAGAPANLLSVTPSGEVLRWDSQTAIHTLVLLAVQPVKSTQDGPRIVPGIPSTMLGLIELQLRAAAPQVEHILFEPAIVGSRVVATPGYDVRARAIVTMPHRERKAWATTYRVTERPTEAEAQAAFELLDEELLSDFPWAAPRDRARAMALLLTSVCRSEVTAAPGFVADANEKGTGKSELMAMMRTLAQGSKAAASWTLGRHEDAESRKALAAAMLTRSTRFWHNDEVRGPINSAFVGQVITAADGSESIRELGTNKLVPVRGVVVTACGNNVTLADDHARRWLSIRLEKPLLQLASGRQYRHPDLAAFIVQNRPALVAAAHTLVLRAAQQGPSRPLPTLNLAASWSQRILGALSWVETSVEGERVSVASLVIEGWEADVAGADHHVEEWADALAFAWAHLEGKEIPAGAFGLLVLAGDDLPVPDELVMAGPRQRGPRWSAALKNLRNRKIIKGDRVFLVTAETKDGRWAFGVQAHDLRALQAGDKTPLIPEPLLEAQRKVLDARMARSTF